VSKKLLYGTGRCPDGLHDRPVTETPRNKNQSLPDKWKDRQHVKGTGPFIALSYEDREDS